MYTNKLWLIAAMIVCISSCHTETGTLKIIPVDITQNTPVKLSEITSGEIKEISLELTDKSTIGWIKRVIYLNDLLIILDVAEKQKF